MQAKHRQNGVIPTTQEYIDIRRDSSGLKPLIDLFEYTLHIDLPECVVDDPVMRSLKQCVNDFCTWSNVSIEIHCILHDMEMTLLLGSFLF